MQAAPSACQSAGPTKKKRPCGHQRETCSEGLRVAPASVVRASTVGSHSAHARKWRDDGIQQLQATEKYSCASAAEKAAHLNSWTLPHDDRVDGAAEENVEMDGKQAVSRRGKHSFYEELDLFDTLEGVVGHWLEHGFSSRVLGKAQSC